MPFTIESARGIFPQTQSADAVPATIARFEQLNAEDQLALIWFAYLEMGKTITVAAPGATSMVLAENTLNEMLKMKPVEQSQAMCDLANREDTPISRTYASWTPNLKLGFWYQLGEYMNQGKIAPIPDGYQLSANANAVLLTIEGLEQGQQITVLRNMVVDMGYEKGKEQKTVTEPVNPPTEMSKRSNVSIEGVSNQTVLSIHG